MLPMILGLMISSIASGQVIARTGKYRIFPTLGTAFMAAGFLLFTFATPDKPIWFMMAGMLLVGLGLGQLMQTLTIASQNSVGPRDIGVATSTSTFFRQIGGTLGTAVLFSVLFTRIPDTLGAAFGDPTIVAGVKAAASDPAVLADPANAGILALLKNPAGLGTALDGDTSFLNAADPRLSQPFLVGFNDATVTVFWVSLVVVLIAFVLSLFLKVDPLRKTSAMQEAADEHAAAEASERASEAMIAQHAADTMGALVEPGLDPDEFERSGRA